LYSAIKSEDSEALLQQLMFEVHIGNCGAFWRENLSCGIRSQAARLEAGYSVRQTVLSAVETDRMTKYRQTEHAKRNHIQNI